MSDRFYRGRLGYPGAGDYDKVRELKDKTRQGLRDELEQVKRDFGEDSDHYKDLLRLYRKRGKTDRVRQEYAKNPSEETNNRRFAHTYEDSRKAEKLKKTRDESFKNRVREAGKKK